MARNLEVLVRITRKMVAMANSVHATGTATPIVAHYARTVIALHGKGKPIQRRYIKSVAKAYMVLVQTNAGTVANLLNNVARNRRKGAAQGQAFFTKMARNDMAVVRALRVGHATGTFVAVATAKAQLATLVSVNAARIAALQTGYTAQVVATATHFYRATRKLANAKQGSYRLWDQWHNAVTVNGFALNDQLVDDAIAHLRRMPGWSVLCRTVQAKFNLGSYHPVILLGDELPG